MIVSGAPRVRGYPPTIEAARPQNRPTEASQAKDDDNETITSWLLIVIAISSVIGLGALAWGSYKLYASGKTLLAHRVRLLCVG
jgi:hypothetical protein